MTLVPDNLGGLLKELPSLPSRQAILLGWAATVPTLVEITELPEEHRPKSPDPLFWDVWTGKEKRPINWQEIADDWTGIPSKPVEVTEQTSQPVGPQEDPQANKQGDPPEDSEADPQKASQEDPQEEAKEDTDLEF